jgi:quinol monooxygenase YgiN
MRSRKTGGVLRLHPAGPTASKRKSIMSHQVKITAILAARPGKADELKTLLDGMIAPCRAEPGNLRWDIWQDQADPTRFVLDELYTGNDAIAAHRATPHFAAYVAKIGDLAERTAILLDPVAVA